MVERRPLVEGILKPPPDIDPKLEKAFVFGARSEPTPPEPPSQNLSRVPFSTRIRSDLANALKKASLERQLGNITPNTVQEILEQALESWLANSNPK